MGSVAHPIRNCVTSPNLLNQKNKNYKSNVIASEHMSATFKGQNESYCGENSTELLVIDVDWLILHLRLKLEAGKVEEPRWWG